MTHNIMRAIADAILMPVVAVVTIVMVIGAMICVWEWVVKGMKYTGKYIWRKFNN